MMHMIVFTDKIMLAILQIDSDIVNTSKVLDWYANQYMMNRSRLSGKLLPVIKVPKEISVETIPTKEQIQAIDNELNRILPIDDVDY